MFRNGKKSARPRKTRLRTTSHLKKRMNRVGLVVKTKHIILHAPPMRIIQIRRLKAAIKIKTEAKDQTTIYHLKKWPYFPCYKQRVNTCEI